MFEKFGIWEFLILAAVLIIFVVFLGLMVFVLVRLLRKKRRLKNEG